MWEKEEEEVKYVLIAQLKLPLPCATNLLHELDMPKQRKTSNLHKVEKTYTTKDYKVSDFLKINAPATQSNEMANINKNATGEPKG